MRKGIDGLAMLVQDMLRHDRFRSHLFACRGRKANLIKIVDWDGTSLCLFTKRLEHGIFIWPPHVEPGNTLAQPGAAVDADRRRWQAEQAHKHNVWPRRIGSTMMLAMGIKRCLDSSMRCMHQCGIDELCYNSAIP